MLLEALVSPGVSLFSTLTYSPRMAPAGGSLNLRDYQLFLKRLRKLVGPFRYYIVGEYGERNFRPHYHAALFGVSDTRSVTAAWHMGDFPVGHVDHRELGPESAHYMLGYMTKRMTDSEDPRLQGRFPEFARMSLKPGIGALAMEEVIRLMYSSVGSQMSEVPRVLRVGGRIYPLGSYLRAWIERELRARAGLPDWSARRRSAELPQWAANLLVEKKQEGGVEAREAKRRSVNATIQARVRIEKSKRSIE